MAKYNVNAYISGKLETVDVDYLGSLGSGATPYLVQLAESADPQVAASAKIQLDNRTYRRVFDIRDWNYTDYLSDTLLVD